MEKIYKLNFESSLTGLCEANSSFDTGVLKIAYTGENRNKSSISKEVFEKCLPSIYNCPVVCNYDRETDSFGGHDMELVCNNDGKLSLVNITHPIGFVPQNAKTWWETVEEDGVEHEYLFADILLWKRQEAYKKLKSDGVSFQSMEVKVKSGVLKDGIFEITDFEFTAFCLIDCQPCFEGASAEVYSAQDFKYQMEEMMKDFKLSFNLVNTSFEVDDKNNDIAKGGEEVLNEETIKGEVAEVENTDSESAIEEVGDVGIEEVNDVPVEDSETVNDGSDSDSSETQNFSLTKNIEDELRRVIGEIKIERSWGKEPKYYYEGCDIEQSKVYCWDAENWTLWGFDFAKNGDSVSIDFDSKKRMKYEIVEFDGGEQDVPFAEVFSEMERRFQSAKEFEEKFNEASETINAMNAEVQSLKQYKADVESKERSEALDKILAKFADLDGVEEFSLLKENKMSYEVNTLEEKCYALRGRYGTTAKFALEAKAPKLMVEQHKENYEPYGGLFVEFGEQS